MIKNQRKVSIFLDTNILQTFLSKKNVFLHKIGVPSDYYNLTKFIDDNGLNEEIEICIPKVVIMEYKQHMISCFSRNIKELENQIEECKKIFGSLIEFNCNFKIKEEDYLKYIDDLFENFVSNPRNKCKIVPYSGDDKLIDILLYKALNGVKPFFSGKIGSKSHSDAGFKDSIIAETIYDYCRANNRIGIFISQDNDFAEVFSTKLDNENDFVQLPSIEKVIKQLEIFFETNQEIKLKNEFTKNTYWYEYLLNEIGMELDNSVTEKKLINISKLDENIYIIRINFIINESTYSFNVNFDTIANDIIDFNYEILEG